ncbi:MAG: MinD/ParA family protein [Acidobacteriota bacterium]|nr:MinD/ParA family protein [Acidobacteriota bacterium]
MVTIAVTSGKGGVGKTSVVVNLAVALARLRHRVAILDADFGLGNVDVLLGLTPAFHLGHLLTGEKSLDEIMVTGPFGVRIIPASSGLRDLTALTVPQWRRLNAACDVLDREIDFLVIDTAPGISDNVIEMLQGSGRVVVVTSLEPSAIVDAYAVIKILTTNEPAKAIGLLVNGARSETEARMVFRQLDVAVQRFLGRTLEYDGFIPRDPGLRESVLAQRAIVDHRPQSPASRGFRALASRMVALEPPDGGSGLRLWAAGRYPAGPADAEVPQCA